MNFDRIDEIAASVLDGYLVKKIWLEHSAGNSLYLPM